MASSLIFVVAVIIGIFFLLRLIGGRSRTASARRGAGEGAKRNKLRRYAQHIQKMSGRMRNADDSEKRKLAKRMDVLLRKKQRAKKDAVRAARKS